MQLLGSEVFLGYSFDAVVEVAVQKNKVVNSSSTIKLIKQLDCEVVHIVPSFHEENAP